MSASGARPGRLPSSSRHPPTWLACSRRSSRPCTGGSSDAAAALRAGHQQRRGFARALEAMGRLDGVIANAGFVTISPLVDMTLKQYDELQRVAQHGAFITLREGARHMVARAEAGDRGGSLIATGSLTNFT